MDRRFERVGGPFDSTVTDGPVQEGRTLLFTDRLDLDSPVYPDRGRFEEYLARDAPSGLARDCDEARRRCGRPRSRSGEAPQRRL
jgi:hypothetical protein